MKKFDISNLIITKICDIYKYTLPRESEGASTAKHSLLIIKLGGNTLYSTAGHTSVADVDHAVYIPAGTEYKMSVEHAGECFVAEIDVAEATEASGIQQLFTENDKEIIATAKSALQYWKLKGPAYHSKCLSELYTLVTLISTIDASALSLAGKYGLIHRSVKYIEANYRRADLYTPDLAKMSGIGETYYRNIFISVFNVAPTKYIQNYRVEKAKELLVKSSASIDDIAIAVGFANASYFCKVFKSTTGLTPKEFVAKSKTIG